MSAAAEQILAEGVEVSADEIPVLREPRFHCFACSPDHDHGLRLRMWRSPGTLTAVTVFDEAFSSYPGVVHGGIVATAVDDLMANLILLEREQLTFTTTLRIRYLRPVSTGTTCRIVAGITGTTPESITAQADLLAADGHPSAMATASYQPIRSANARSAFGLSTAEHERLKPFLDIRDEV